MKDWLNEYGSNPQKFQEGGPTGGGAPAPAEGPNLDAMLAEYAQTRDPQLAVAIADMLVELVASQGGGAPGGAPAGPEGGAPMARQGAKTAPIFKA